jgi:6-phosphogluconolactonase
MGRWIGRVAGVVTWLVLTMTTGCKGFFVYPGSTNNNSSPSGSGDYVYVASAGSQTLTGFSVSAGALTEVTAPPYSLGFIPTAVAVNPADTIVFVAGNGTISAFSILSGGGLSVLNSSVETGDPDVISMDISPDGNWLIALDGTGSTSGVVSIDEFQITSNASVLTANGRTTFNVSTNAILPRAIKFSPNGELLCAALGTAGDLMYTFTSQLASGALSGALTNPQTISAPATPMSDNGLGWSADSSTLYIARSNSTSNGQIAVYSVSNGSFGASFSSYPAGVQPTAVAVNSVGTNEYVYVANQSDSTISGYSVASNVVLSALSGSPYTAGSAVGALAVDRTGDYLLATALGGTPDLELFSLNSGQLGPSATAQTGAGILEPAGAVALATTH